MNFLIRFINRICFLYILKSLEMVALFIARKSSFEKSLGVFGINCYCLGIKNLCSFPIHTIKMAGSYIIKQLAANFCHFQALLMSSTIELIWIKYPQSFLIFFWWIYVILILKEDIALVFQTNRFVNFIFEYINNYRLYLIFFCLLLQKLLLIFDLATHSIDTILFRDYLRSILLFLLHVINFLRFYICCWPIVVAGKIQYLGLIFCIIRLWIWWEWDRWDRILFHVFKVVNVLTDPNLYFFIIILAIFGIFT